MARRVVLDFMRDGVIVLDRQQRVADVNVAAEKIIGRPINDVLGQHIQKLMPQLDWLQEDAITREDEIVLAGQTYELQVSPLYSNETVNGRLLLFHNITPRKKVEAELTRQSALLKNLVIIARATTTTHTLKATLQNILDVSVSMSQAEYGSLFVINAKGEITHSILAQDEALPMREQQAVNQQVLEKGLFGWVLRHGTLALVCDTGKDERWLSIPERRSQKVGSALAVPIADSRGVIGVLTLTHSQVDYFHEEQASLMQGAADQMALALRNAQLYDQQAHLAEREHILYEVIRATGESLDAKMITRTAVDAISHFTAWPALAILLGREGFLVVDAATGALTGTEGTLMPIGGDIIGRAFKQNRVETAVDFNDNGLLSQFHSGVAVPLRHSDKVIGVLTAQSETTDRFGKEDAQLAESLAEAVALALENAWLHNNIRKNAADLNTLLESSRDGIIYLGLDKNVRVINEPAVTMLGLTKPTTHWTTRPLNSIFEAVQTHLAESQDPNMDSLTSLLALQDEISLIRTGTEPVTEGDLLLPPHMLRWLNLPVKTDNEALGRLLVLRDVTEEWQLERMRDDLIHMTVHDLRNPLSAQIMALEVLAHDLPPAQRPIYDVLDANSRRMLNLVNNILDINRLENRKMPLSYTYVTASDLIDTAMKQQKSLARQKHIKLEKEVTDELPFAWIDEVLIERVLQNLIGNAVKFTPNEGTIRVSVQSDVESYGEMLCVSVFNTGEGIPPDLRDRMFQKFSTGKQEGRGSGLGLAFCKMVVEAHNGRIWLDSIPGQSATFHFTIPAA
jgi:PAS domain S-box-containing protein